MQVFQDIGIYGSSALQFLDLSMSEFCLYSQSHVLSLEFVLGVLLWNSQRGDYKIVIYNHVFVGFNSMSNLIVFFQYFPYIFVGFNVRVKCESLKKKGSRQ